MTLDLIHSSMIDGPVGGAGLPVGAVVFSPTGIVFPGFLELNGQSCAEYPDLCALLGSTTVPDFRNRVPRHEGDLAGVSGATQEDTVGPHIHGLPVVAGAGPGATFSAGNAGERVATYATDLNDLTVETRVKAYIGKYLIKAASGVVNEGTLDMLALGQAVSQGAQDILALGQAINDKLSKNGIVGRIETGSVIEGGAGANGNYLKFADGTQICHLDTTLPSFAISTNYSTSLFQGSFSWIFPSRFVDRPAVSCGHLKWGSSGSWPSVSNVSNTSATLRALDVVSRAAGETTASVMAVGRWK